MKINWRIKLASLIVLNLILLSGCSKNKVEAIDISSASAVTIQTSEIAKYNRVIGLANGSAEIISALGLKKVLIGRDIASTDEDLKSVPIVTSGHQVVAEKIISLKPDLVLIDKSSGPKSALTTLQKAGIKVFEIPEAWQVSDIAVKVEAIANELGVTESGRNLISMISAKSPSLLSSGGSNKKVRVAFLYLRGGSSIYLIGGKGSGADSLLSAVGATDVGAEKLKNPFTAMTSEEMVSLNPQVILVMTKGLASTGGVSGLISLPGVAQTEAGRNKRVISVDDSLLLSFGPRTPDLLVKLQAAINEVMK